MIRGEDELNKKMQQMSDINTPLFKAIKRQTEVVRGYAVKLCPANHGELRASIQAKVTPRADSVTGEVYTNKEYAMYVEFGTGQKGQASHSGISPAVHPTYRSDPWWIPEGSIDSSDAERYHMQKRESSSGTFYKSYGQAAQPFMYPALKQNEGKVKEALADDIRKDMK